MNRRGFLSGILKTGIAAMVLPPALTYARQWKPLASGIFTADISGCGLLTRCNAVHLTAEQLERLFRPELDEMNQIAYGCMMLNKFELENIAPLPKSLYDFLKCST